MMTNLVETQVGLRVRSLAIEFRFSGRGVFDSIPRVGPHHHRPDTFGVLSALSGRPVEEERGRPL